MLNWEYTNFSELIPFCDPNAEENHTSSLIPEQFNFFPGLGLNCPAWTLDEIFLPPMGKFLYHVHGSHGLQRQ